MTNKKRIHIIHHTHWDMEWFFTKYDSSALFNYVINHLLNQLEKQDQGSFLFDGQVAPFEEILKNPSINKRIKKLVKSNKLQLGPWYSQPDMRLTSDIGLLRNFEYGKSIAGIKTNNYNHLWVPDSFGFGENIPILFKHLIGKYAFLWRGVNRKLINNSPVFTWKAQNNEAITIYNMASGYFVGRYMYDDKSLKTLYKNNIAPSIKYQSYGGKYKNVLMPSGGDQQPFNSDLKNAINKLNKIDKNNQYFLSDVNTFIKDFKKEIKTIPTYKGSLTYAYGGRLHKTVGSHRPDIKQGIFKNELFVSQVLEPLLLSTNYGDQNYPHPDLDLMWKNILLSQAHDAYASCNSDEVNKQIINRLDIATNIALAQKDMVMTFISQNYKDNTLLITNPTLFEGFKLFKTTISTLSKDFSIVDKKGQNIPFIIYDQKQFKGGKKVVYISGGEIETQKSPYFNSYIYLYTNVKKQKINTLKVIDKSLSKAKFNSSFDVRYKNKKFLITKGKSKQKIDLLFKLDAGDSYDLDLYSEVHTYSLKNAKLIKSQTISKSGLKIKTFYFSIKLPNSIKSWTTQKLNFISKFKVEFVISNNIKIKIAFESVPSCLLVQQSFETYKNQTTHQVMTQFGYINRANKFSLPIERDKLREPVSNFDIMHGSIIYGSKTNNISIVSVDVREYIFNSNQLNINLFRTPDVLGRANLRSRKGRASGPPDLTVKTPDSAKSICNRVFEIDFDFNQNTKKLKNIFDGVMIQDMAMHIQKLYLYYSRTNAWTLPSIRWNLKLEPKIKISNKDVRLLSLYKTSTHYVAIINNIHFDTIKTNIKFENKTYKNITLKRNEIKEFKIKIS